MKTARRSRAAGFTASSHRRRKPRQEIERATPRATRSQTVREPRALLDVGILSPRRAPVHPSSRTQGGRIHRKPDHQASSYPRRKFPNNTIRYPKRGRCTLRGSIFVDRVPYDSPHTRGCPASAHHSRRASKTFWEVIASCWPPSAANRSCRHWVIGSIRSSRWCPFAIFWPNTRPSSIRR